MLLCLKVSEILKLTFTSFRASMKMAVISEIGLFLNVNITRTLFELNFESLYARHRETVYDLLCFSHKDHYG